MTKEDAQKQIDQKLKEIEDILSQAYVPGQPYPEKLLKLSPSQIRFAQRQVGRWLNVGGNTRSSADADHSALLFRLLSGKEPLDKAPPVRMSYPWYELGEGNKIKLHPDRDGVVTDEKRVSVGNSGPFEWHDEKEGILIHPPSKQLFRITVENGDKFIQKV